MKNIAVVGAGISGQPDSPMAGGCPTRGGTAPDRLVEAVEGSDVGVGQ